MQYVCLEWLRNHSLKKGYFFILTVKGQTHYTLSGVTTKIMCLVIRSCAWWVTMETMSLVGNHGDHVPDG